MMLLPEVVDRGVVRIAASADLPRPHVAVMAGVHGNEPCGIRAMQRFVSELEAGQLELAAGTLYLVRGNPEAHEQGRRHTLGGVDLQWQFDYRYLTDVPKERWVYEHHRALELRPMLESVDALLDLHSFNVPTPAFAIASSVPESQALADALGLAYVTTGWERLLGDRLSLAPLTRRGLPAVAVECGQHSNPKAVEVAYDCMRRVLDHFGVVSYAKPRLIRVPKHLEVRAVVKRPSPTFRFARRLSSMQELAAGEPIGHDEGVRIAAQRDCHVITPNGDGAVGEPMLFIAEAARSARQENVRIKPLVEPGESLVSPTT